MTATTLGISPDIARYLAEVGVREHPAQTSLRALTDTLADGDMRTSVEAAAMISFLTETTGAKRALEVGCFTGHGTLAIALAMPADGRVTTLDVNGDWAELGRRYWRQAGVEQKIEFREGLALDSLDALLAEGQADAFDLALIDADKKSYPLYFDRVRRLVRPGGVILLDNTLWRGRVVDLSDDSKQTRTLRALNMALHGDQAFSYVLIPVGDGMTLLRRRH